MVIKGEPCSSVDPKATKLSFYEENSNPDKIFKLKYTIFFSHITKTSYSKLRCSGPWESAGFRFGVEKRLRILQCEPALCSAGVWKPDSDAMLYMLS